MKKLTKTILSKLSNGDEMVLKKLFFNINYEMHIIDGSKYTW